MSSSQKYLFNIQKGDRILYKGSDVLDDDYPAYQPLSGDVLHIYYKADNRIQLQTSSGLLKPYSRTSTFEVVMGDYEDVPTQRQYDVKAAETYAGASIE